MNIYVIFNEDDGIMEPIQFFHSEQEAEDFVHSTRGRAIKGLMIIQMTLGVSGYKIIWPE